MNESQNKISRKRTSINEMTNKQSNNLNENNFINCINDCVVCENWIFAVIIVQQIKYATISLQDLESLWFLPYVV